MATQNKIYIKRQFNCSPAKLFDWLVQPNLIAQWFGPKHLSVESVQTDLRVGGQYAIALLKPDQQQLTIAGEYLEIKAPNSLVFSLQYQGLPSTPPDSIVKMDISALAEGVSQLLFTQEFVTLPLDMDRRTAAWEYMFQLLEGLLFE